MRRLEESLPTAVWTTRGLGKDEEEPLWEIRRRINPVVFALAPNKHGDDAVVPRGSLVKAVDEFVRISKEYNVIMVTYGHVGDGNIHVNVLYNAEDPDEKRRADEAIHAVSRAAVAMGGSESGEHGIGVVKDVLLQISRRERDLMRQVKACFDPHGIMNPGKGY